ncbi:hypothetical protein M569_06126 [Genlisea aurea]|uniref:1-phosphatidylinositol 4-kinase n=1 Tax=Genlisea aurea TaxID=192259 RepID=S8CN81_9LAMI|nr:hypothetical protein M569_06126 [Genlisea aurea]
MAVAVDPGHGFAPLARPPRCKLPSFTQFDYKMLLESKTATVEDAVFHRSFSTPCLSHHLKDDDDDDRSSSIEIIVGHGAPRVRAMVVEVAIAMASGISPEPTSNGLGGAYFLRALNGDTIAVAKPIDEEPLAFNNPKGLVGRMLGQPGMKCSIRIGETGLRESAAYLLDHDGFAGVPPTALVRFTHVRFNSNTSDSASPVHKIASLQRYVRHDSDAGDLGPSSFSVTSVHHIGILDVRLMNLDRHAGNILVRSFVETTAAELVPIDHGFCLPESLDDPYFEWLHWPQALIPFSETEIDYISSLDPEKDAMLLRSGLPSISESSVRVLIVCTVFLKQAAASGLCLADIGEMMTREFHAGQQDRSVLENICITAKSSLKLESPNKNEAEAEAEATEEIFQLEEEEEVVNSSPSSILNAVVAQNNNNNQSNILRFPSRSSSSDDDQTAMTTHGSSSSSSSNNNKQLVGLMRSRSYHVPSHGGECISFGEMDEETWQTFLEKFEWLLPEAFEERKVMTGLSKLRLGSSCEF